MEMKGVFELDKRETRNFLPLTSNHRQIPVSLFSRKKKKKNLRNGSRPTTPELCASIRSEASISREGSSFKVDYESSTPP